MVRMHRARNVRSPRRIMHNVFAIHMKVFFCAFCAENASRSINDASPTPVFMAYNVEGARNNVLAEIPPRSCAMGAVL